MNFLPILASFLPLLLLLILGHSSAYKILIYSQTLTRSHVLLNARVAEALAEDGHNVTILEVEYLDPLTEFTGSKAEGVRKILVPGDFMPKLEKGMLAKSLVMETFKRQSVWTLLAGMGGDFRFQEAFNAACQKFLDEHGELMEQLRADKFDLFIGEQINFCGSGLSHLLNIPVHVLLVSCPIQEHVASILGLPYPTSFVPSLYGIPMGDQMTMGQRLVNWVGAFVHGQVFLHGVDHLTAMFRRNFGPDFPDVRDIVKDSPLVFVNVDEFVEFPRPLFPNIVYIGGLEFDRKNASGKAAMAGKLGEQFQREMAKGQNGIVFFSLGSAVNTAFLPDAFKRNLLGAFAQLPNWHFLLKISDSDQQSRELAKGMPNVFLTSWAPQKAILAHYRTKLFITHGGYNSLMESAMAGCPVLSIGFFADQRRNGLLPERNGWGLAFAKEKLLEGGEEFRLVMSRILEEPAFGEGAKRLAKVLATKPFSARQNLLRHIRFLEQNGGVLPELMAESRNMDAIALHNIDLWAIALAALAIILMAAWKLASCCCRCILRRRKRKVE